MDNRPIGIFDSGIGGTSIWREIVGLLPFEKTIYLADTKNMPYGAKSKKDILELSIKNTNILLEKGAKVIVVACNTATTNAIGSLRNTYDIPFIGIEPAIKPAALHTRTKKIGVLATKGTLASSLFSSTARMHAQGIEVYEQHGDGLVECIESGDFDSSKLQRLLTDYVEPMVQKGIDRLVLGCTHYPYLVPLLKKIVPPEVQIIDSAHAVARQTGNILGKHNLLNTGKKEVSHHFYSNSGIVVLSKLLTGPRIRISFMDF